MTHTHPSFRRLSRGRHSGESRNPVNKQSLETLYKVSLLNVYVTGCRVKPGMMSERVTPARTGDGIEFRPLGHADDILPLFFP